MSRSYITLTPQILLQTIFIINNFIELYSNSYAYSFTTVLPKILCPNKLTVCSWKFRYAVLWSNPAAPKFMRLKQIRGIRQTARCSTISKPLIAPN